MPNKGRRLPKEVISFIKAEESSYREIRQTIENHWGFKIGKSLVSYYKHKQPRVKTINLSSVAPEDWQWFQGLYSADGSKTINEGKYGKHYIIIVSLDKKHDLAIAQKSTRILKDTGLSPTLLRQGNCLRLKATSKQLFKALTKTPSESAVTPAYVAGALDGDGSINHRAMQFGQSRVPELFDAIADFFAIKKMPVKTWLAKKNYRRMYIPYSALKSSGVLKYSIKARNIENGGAGEI